MLISRTKAYDSITPVIGSDLITTICKIADAPLLDDRTIDGANLFPLFEGKLPC